MSYRPAQHAHCHVCGLWTRLTDRRLMYRHRYGGASGADYCVGGRHRAGEIISGYAGPYARDPREHGLKEPAVSSPSPGGIENPPQRNERITMHLNITTTDGSVKAVRAYVSSEDGTQGVFAEADDHATAIAQAAGAVLSGATAATFTGNETPAPKQSTPMRFSAVAPDFPTTSRRVVTGRGAIKALVRGALEDDKQIFIHWRDGHALSSTRVKVYPLYETARGFVGRDTGRRVKTYAWDDITRAEGAAR